MLQSILMVQTATRISLEVQIAINQINKLYHRNHLYATVCVFGTCDVCIYARDLSLLKLKTRLYPYNLVFVWVGLVGKVTY